jgi:hypothetical protein
MSETNSASCQRHDDAQAGNGLAHRASSFAASSVCSVPLVQGSGDPQRDGWEAALHDADEFETVCHPPGIEETSPFDSSLECNSGALNPVQLETRGVTPQKTKTFQRELWARQTMHKNTVAAKLREAGREQLAWDLESCHSETTWCICKNCSTAKPFLNRCERFYCPECQPTLSKDRERSVGWWAREMSQPKHVVLTLKNFPRLNKKIVQWAKAAFGKLRRRKFAKNWVGGFYNWEVTNEGKGWHLHVHALVESKWIDSGLLALEWAKVTRGLGRIVKVLDARRVDYLKEVTKYAVKGSQLAAWNGDQIKMFIDAFSGVRTFGVFGSLFSKRTKFKDWLKQLQEHRLKCKCGCEEFWYQSDVEYQLSDTMPMSEGATNAPPSANVRQLNFVSV